MLLNRSIPMPANAVRSDDGTPYELTASAALSVSGIAFPVPDDSVGRYEIVPFGSSSPAYTRRGLDAA